MRNPVSAGGRILDVVEIQGAHFLVTMDQPECFALPEWLAWELGAAKPAPAPPPLAPAPAPPAAATREPGEFTQLFQKSPAPNAPRVEERPIVPAPPVAPAAPSAPAAGPGEFTQLFERPRQSQRMEPQPTPPSMPVAPAPIASENQPGEFTKLFRSPLSPPSETSREPLPLPVSSPSQNAPGEFTRIFGGGTPRGGAPLGANVPPAAPTAPTLRPRSFQRRFRRPDL